MLILPHLGIVKRFAVCSDVAMSQPSTRPTLYKGYRFPAEIISRCVWLYYRFGVSLRDVSELMLARDRPFPGEPPIPLLSAWPVLRPSSVQKCTGPTVRPAVPSSSTRKGAPG